MPVEQSLYLQLAEKIAHAIRRGTLARGERVPSVREQARREGVSLSTVVQAYRWLEDSRWIEARPRSGYFVTARPPRLPEPETSLPPAASHEVLDISTLTEEVMRRAHDPAFVSFGAACPNGDLFTPERVRRAISRATQRHRDSLVRYPIGPGHESLRRAIARHSLGMGCQLDARDILVTNGCLESISLCLRAVTKPGDVVALESPTYFGLLQVLQSLSLKALELPTDAREGIDIGALRAACEGQRIAACVLASSFSNPLGATLAESRKLEVLALLAKHRLPLIEDDIYGDLGFGTAPLSRPFMALDKHGNTLHCSSFSKTLAPGYRIGWVAAGARHMPRLIEAKVASTLCGPVLPQLALAEFLASGGYDHHLRRVRRVFQDTLHRMVRAIDESFPAGTRVSQPQGGFVLWLELPRGIDTRRLFAQALERGICFAPGVVFSASGRYANCLRVSGGHGWSPRIDKGLRALGAMARAWTR